MKSSLSIMLIACLAFVSSDSNAQGKFGVFLGLGTTLYEGDLKEQPWPHPLSMRWTANAGLHWQVNKRWGLQLNYTAAHLAGDDRHAASPNRHARGFRFENITHEISIRGTYDILKNDKWRFLPYLTAGVGALYFEPKRDGVPLRPLATEGVNYLPVTVSFPAGVGVKYQINCRWNMKLEAIYHWTMTDYLDDVSGAYLPPTGDPDVDFYRDPGGVSPPREMRGNPKWKDGYWDINIGVVYYFKGCGSGKKGGMLEDCDALYEGVDMDKLMEQYNQ
jgi:opacity protein-like surface antigen